MKSMKKFLAGLLALALLPGLAACGEKTEPAGPSAAPAAGESAGQRYTAEFRELRSGRRGSVTPLCYTGEGFYAKVYENMGQRQLGEGVTVDYEGQYDVYQDRFCFVGYDGSFRLLEDYSPACVWENTQGYADFETSGSLAGLFVNEAGELVALETYTASYYTGPEGLSQVDDEYWQYVQTEDRCFLRRLDRNGGELSQAEPELGGSLFVYDSCVPDQEGNLLMAYLSDAGDSCVLALREDGSEAYRLNFDGYIERLVLLSGGRPAVLGSLPSGWGLQLIDSGAKRFGESYGLPDEALELFPGDGDYDFYYSGGSGLYGYRLETGERQTVLNWLDCDVNGSDLSGLTVRPEGTFLAVENDWEGEEVTASLVTLRPADDSAAAEKRVLTLAAVDLDYNAQNAVIAFNRQSPDTRIQVLDYGQYNAGPGDTAGLTKLTTEILSGKLPDILALSGLPYDQLAAKGLLEDLYPWLDGDGELSREDFFPSVLRAMETGGGLYQVCPYFSVSTAIGARDVVGDRQGWTYEDLYAALAALPEGSTIFSASMTKTEALRKCLEVNMDSLVDWASGSCRFDGEEFLALLDFANRFPAEAPEESGGTQLLRSVTVNEFRSMAFDELYFGGEGSTVYIGYPSFDGSCGSAIVLDEGFAMSAACADKEAAWAFLRVFMTADYQSNQYKLPGNRARFEKNLAVAMTPSYQLDEEGNYVLDADGNRVQQPIVYLDGMPIYCTTQGQADRLRGLVESCTKAVRPATEDILGIILDDAGACFAGQKSAQEVAGLIQSKVSLYMGEQK